MTKIQEQEKLHLNMTTEYLQVDKNIHIAFTVVGKAFDNINRNIMFKPLKNWFQGPKNIYNLYKNQTELRQGYGLSPTIQYIHECSNQDFPYVFME